MSPDGQVVRGEVKDDQNDQDVDGDRVEVGEEDEPIDDEDVGAKEKSPELVDSGNDSDQLIGSAEEEDALKDSDDEVDGGGGALNLPAAIAAALPAANAAYDDDVPERPPPNKKHKCLQVCNSLFLI